MIIDDREDDIWAGTPAGRWMAAVFCVCVLVCVLLVVAHG